MSLNHLYEMSRRSFRVFTAQMNTAGQNVANAETPGYTRRRLVTQAEGPVPAGLFVQPAPHGGAGAGTSADRFERMRDSLLQSASWEAQSGLGGAEEETRLLSALEGLFGVGSGASLQDVLGGFWNAWGDLANHPTDTGVRTTLLRQAEAVAGALGTLNRSMEGLQAETQEALAGGVDRVNALLGEMAALNGTIQDARAAGSPDLAAEDQRDALVAELAAFAPVRVSDDGAGYTLTIAGMAVVQGDHVHELTLEVPPKTPAPTVRFAGTDVAVPAAPGDGRLGAWLSTLGETLPETRARLDAFAAGLATAVNAEHAAGYGLDGTTGRAFFAPDGLTAGTFRVSSDVSDPAAIAAAGAPDAPGDSGRALAVAGLRSGFDEQAIDLVVDVGARLRQARTAAGAQAAVADHLDAMAQSVSGVSLDEEMTHLLEAQHAFAAAARVLNTADEMMDTLLAL